MKYVCKVEIALPRARVVELFDDPDNLPRWQDGLQSFEPLEGTPGQPGATTRLRYKMGKREIEMVETIVDRTLPDRFIAAYQTKGVWNQIDNRFTELGPDRTGWAMACAFRLSGIFWLMGALAPGMFRKQTRRQMEDFKRFAESA